MNLQGHFFQITKLWVHIVAKYLWLSCVSYLFVFYEIDFFRFPFYISDIYAVNLRKCARIFEPRLSYILVVPFLPELVSSNVQIYCNKIAVDYLAVDRFKHWVD